MPKYGYSEQWNIWVCDPSDPKTCSSCRSMFHRIIHVEDSKNHPPLHENCRCYLEPLKSVQAGTATKDGKNGADWHLRHYGRLPDNYISAQEAKDLGWIRRKCNLYMVAPGKMIGGEIYYNDDGRLPSSPGRIWHEADFDYQQGCRNASRIVYSNDGLAFVTYDHYSTFHEIVD